MKAVASYITSEWVCSVTATLTLIVEKGISISILLDNNNNNYYYYYYL